METKLFMCDKCRRKYRLYSTDMEVCPHCGADNGYELNEKSNAWAFLGG